MSREQNKIYKRPRENDTLKCGKCSTVWREEYVERQGRDKNVISCPFCHEWFDALDCEIVHLPATTLRNNRLRRVLQQLTMKETLMAEEKGTTAFAADVAKLKVELDELRKEKEIRQFPARVRQNCLSHGFTIKPQIDWVEFDILFSEKVTRLDQ